MSKLLSLLALALPCFANVIQMNFSGSVQNGPECTQMSVCAGVVFQVPQMTDLTSLDWVLTADTNYNGGVNLPWGEPGLPYSYNFTVGLQSDLLGLNVQSVSPSYTGVTGPYGELISSGSGGFGDPALDASGSVSDLAPFDGNGTLALTLMPFGHGSYSNVAFSGINTMTTHVNLELIYDPPEPVPEPRWGVLALLSMMVALRWLAARRRVS